MTSRISYFSGNKKGYKFEARVDDELFIATVPKDGVHKGDIFATQMGDVYSDSRTIDPDRVRTFKDMDAPPFRWRDELFDCFNHGLDHQFLWIVICCPHGKLFWLGSKITCFLYCVKLAHNALFAPHG